MNALMEKISQVKDCLHHGQMLEEETNKSGVLNSCPSTGIKWLYNYLRPRTCQLFSPNLH